MSRRIVMLLQLCLFLFSCEENSVNNDERDPTPFRIIDKEPSWSPDGKTIVYYHMQKIDSSGQLTPDTSGLYLIDSDGANKRILLAGFTHSPDWSPDGKWIVFEQGAQIYKIKSDGDSLTQLTFEGLNFFPSWSHDGKHIAYDSDVDDTKYDIWTMSPNGENKKNISQESDSLDQGGWRRPNWNPDGNWIIHERYISGGEVGTEIFIMDTSGSNAEWLVHGSSPKYSPDGQKVLYLCQPEGLYPQLWAIDIQSKNKTQLTQDGSWAGEWSPDGQSIVFTNTLDGRLWIMNADGANWRQLTFNP